MTTPDLPDSVPFVRFEAALARFNIPIADLCELRIDRHGIAVTQFQRGEHGRHLFTGMRVPAPNGHGYIDVQSGGDFATVETFVPFDRESSA
ncbi:hypothetical protein A6F55_19090 [Prescottella equi]|uniref:hypothetical protein n=1 Tax=Rhodococcus hoagii TaxID=43767 RepID=UPI000A0FB6EF|nr:hypothetical protein [Prescottella equi]ORL01799.1 hypothetical protein A6F55_19090 [Prescottella equi]